MTGKTVQLDKDIAAFISRGVNYRDDNGFNLLMLRCFEEEFATSASYRDYCLKVGATPDRIAAWHEIPAVSSFRHQTRLNRLYPGARAAEVHRESRTVDLAHSRGPFFPEERLVAMMRSAQVSAARSYLLPDLPAMKMLFFLPGPRMAPGMVMASGMERFRQEFGLEGSRFLISFSGLDLQGFVNDLRVAEQSGVPLAIMGATHGLDYFMDACLAAGVSFRLPDGSRIMDSGGFMGRYVATAPDNFFEKCAKVFGISSSYCVNALWICESSTVYFDTTLADAITAAPGKRHKGALPWARVTVVDPLTFRRVPPGQTGLLRLYDLSNRGMAAVVQTDKMGYETGAGFEVVGKLDKSDPRGGVDKQPSHPGGRLISKLMETAMRRKMAGIGRIAAFHRERKI